MLSSSLLAIAAFTVAVVCETQVRLYTRDPISNSVYNKTYDTGVSIKGNSENISVVLNAFQNVVTLEDIGSITLDVNVTTRTSRYIVFCLWSKKPDIPNPRITPIGEKGIDFFKINCSVANETSTLELTSRMLITKPDGLL